MIKYWAQLTLTIRPSNLQTFRSPPWSITSLLWHNRQKSRKSGVVLRINQMSDCQLGIGGDQPERDIVASVLEKKYKMQTQ